MSARGHDRVNTKSSEIHAEKQLGILPHAETSIEVVKVTIEPLDLKTCSVLGLAG